MKIMLTSFGIDRSDLEVRPAMPGSRAGYYVDEDDFDPHDVPPAMPMLRSGYYLDEDDNTLLHTASHAIMRGYQPFRRMPPLDMRSMANGFAPEYSLLILCDKLVFDAFSFEYLTEQMNLPVFEPVGRTLALLKREGFLELRDYTSILAENSSLLARMTQNDLQSTGQWSGAMRSSSRIWRSFTDGLDSKLGSPARNLAWHSPVASGPHRREALSSYLSYVNANLILSNEMEAGLHDWEDFQPFYHRKFLAVGRENPELLTPAEASRQLFDIAFPEFAIRSPEHFMSLLTHKRVGELRSLIEEASRGNVEFDGAFARSVFHEIIGVERTLGKRRRLLGYLTFPIGFIPFVGNYAQFLAEQGAESVVERRLKKKFRWFYLLSDLADKESRRGQSSQL
jgi:hypothetical protein